MASFLKIDSIDVNLASFITFLKALVTPQVTANILLVDQIDKRSGANPTFLTSPLVPTPTLGDYTTKAASTAFTIDQINATVGSANASAVKTALNATGSAPIYACRAWVNFNGTGTVAIRGSGNVSTIGDNGTGDYTVNFTTAMPNANYSPSCMKGYAGNFHGIHFYNQTGSMTTSSFRLQTWIFNSGGVEDDPQICVNVFC